MRVRGIVAHVLVCSFVALVFPRLGVCLDDLAKYSIQHLEQMAIDARNQGNFSAAIAFLDEVVRREPNNLGARSSRGRLLVDENDNEGALKEFDFVIDELRNGRQWPGVELAHLLHRKGCALHALHRFNDALVTVDAALALDPTYVNALNTRGNILKDRGQTEEAFNSYKSALKLSPNFLPAQINLINLAIQLKAYDEARLYCGHMKTGGARAEAGIVSGELDASSLAGKTPVNPSPVMLYWNCAVAFREEGTHEKDYQEFLGLAASAPCYDAADFFYRAEAKRALSESDGALADYSESLSRDSKQLEAYKRKGRILYDQKRYEEAYRLYGEFIDAHPSEALAYQGRAETLISLNRVKDALPDAQRGADLGQNEGYTWETLAWVHNQMGDMPAAEDAYKKLLALDPNHNGARTFLAFRHQDRGEFKELIAMLKPLVDSGKADALDLSRYGYGLLRLGRKEEALTALSGSISKDPSNSFVYSQRAYVLAALGRDTEARVDAEKAKELNPTDPHTVAAAEFYRMKIEEPTKARRLAEGDSGFKWGGIFGAFLRVKLKAASQ